MLFKNIIKIFIGILFYNISIISLDQKNYTRIELNHFSLNFSIVTRLVPCERLLSKVGTTKNQSKNCLSSFRLEKFLFLSDLPDKC